MPMADLAQVAEFAPDAKFTDLDFNDLDTDKDKNLSKDEWIKRGGEYCCCLSFSDRIL